MQRRNFIKSSALMSLLFAAPQVAHARPNPPRVIRPQNPLSPKVLTGKERSVLVVGGGIAGLSAAMELVDRGFQVEIREASSVLGGRLATYDVETKVGQFRVEHGLHMWFHNYHNFKDIRARIGINDQFAPFTEVDFLFRDYERETIKSEPKVYPLNLINIVKNSPNLNFLNAVTQLGLLKDVMFYNHKGLYERLDHMTFPEWAKSAGVHKDYYNVIMQPAASVTLNDAKKISAAEMVMYMHYYFVGSPYAFDREICVNDHATSVIEPWAKYLVDRGVVIKTSSPVNGLRFAGGKITGIAGEEQRYDYVVLATDVKATQRILDASGSEDVLGANTLGLARDRVQPMKTAPHYKVMRCWFDKKPENFPNVLETPQHKPIHLVADFGQLENESREWSEATGGSVLEFHLYDTEYLKDVEDSEVWPRIQDVVLEIMPDMKDAKLLDYTVGSYDNFSSFEVGQGSIRPDVDSLQKDAGLINTLLCGDWINTDYPSALMERSVCTGREAANQILLEEDVQQASLTVTSSHGPGLI